MLQLALGHCLDWWPVEPQFRTSSTINTATTPVATKYATLPSYKLPMSEPKCKKKERKNSFT